MRIGDNRVNVEERKKWEIKGRTHSAQGSRYLTQGLGKETMTKKKKVDVLLVGWKE